MQLEYALSMLCSQSHWDRYRSPLVPLTNNTLTVMHQNDNNKSNCLADKSSLSLSLFFSLCLFLSLSPFFLRPYCILCPVRECSLFSPSEQSIVLCVLVNGAHPPTTILITNCGISCVCVTLRANWFESPQYLPYPPDPGHFNTTPIQIRLKCDTRTGNVFLLNFWHFR